MASDEVTGYPIEEVKRRRQQWVDEHDGDPPEPFGERYCLSPIPKQPDSYDGPQRFCFRYGSYEIGSKHLCKFHGGRLELHPENLNKLAPMKHGMHATREHLVEDFDDKDQALYDWITESYTDAYELSPQDDPSVAYDLHRLAAEIVRAERGRGFLISEGEVHERKVRDEDGRIVTDEKGDIVTEKSEHYLAKMMDRQDKKISRLEKELGVTRKERLKRDQTDDAIASIKSFAEVGKSFIDREGKDYDPEDQPWQNEADESEN